MSVTRPSPTHLERVGPPVIKQQRVVIQNQHGEKLVGISHETGSKELVILCHGFRSSKERIPMVNLAAALGKEGISAFRFDFAGNGESEGSFQYGNYRREADDLRAVVQHFYGEKRVIIALVGHSKGGNVVLLYASKYNDVHTIVNISGRFYLERGIIGRLGQDFLQRIKQNGFIDVKNKGDLKFGGSISAFFHEHLQLHALKNCMDSWYHPEFIGKFQYRVTEESLMDRLTTDTHATCLLIQKDCRVFTVHGSCDEMVPVEDALAFAKIIPNHKLHIIEGADHEFTSHQDELASVVLDFVRSYPPCSKGISEQLPRSCIRADNSTRSRL